MSAPDSDPAPPGNPTAAAALAAEDVAELEAATWALRRRSGLDATARAAFDAWLAADARHACLLAELEATQNRLQALRAASRSAPPHPSASGRRPGTHPVRRPAPAARAGLLSRAGAVACVGLLAVGLWWAQARWPTPFEQRYATAPGELRELRLPDGATSGEPGSQLTLDTATRLDVRLLGDRREVTLHEGQALFSVRSDAGRPFDVRAGALRISVTGTRFSVRRTDAGLDAGQVVVGVEQGRVRVDSLGTRAGEGHHGLDLTAGQMVRADAQGRLGAVQPLETDAAGSWRGGRLVFEQIPLATAIAEFARYGRHGLTVRDPAVAALRIGGSFRPEDWQAFADALPRILPVRLARGASGLEVVARPPGDDGDT